MKVNSRGGTLLKQEFYLSKIDAGERKAWSFRVTRRVGEKIAQNVAKTICVITNA
jgi:hypothetical protein